MTQKQKVEKLIRWIQRQQSRENRIQKSANETIKNPFVEVPWADVANIKANAKMSWEKASGAWLAYSQVINQIKKEFGV